MKLALSILYVAFIGILSFFIGQALPRKAFKEDDFPFKTYCWEQNGRIYEKIKIKKWKDKVPDMSKVMKDMLPKSVSFRVTSNDIGKLIKETCVAEIIHFLLCLLSVGVYYFWKDTTGIILVEITVVCNIPFIIIQRYNRPHLIKIRDKLKHREERKHNANTNIVG